MQLNSIAVTTFEQHMDEEVDNDNKVYKWYEKVDGTKGLYGTNGPWYHGDVFRGGPRGPSKFFLLRLSIA